MDGILGGVGARAAFAVLQTKAADLELVDRSFVELTALFRHGAAPEKWKRTEIGYRRALNAMLI